MRQDVGFDLKISHKSNWFEKKIPKLNNAGKYDWKDNTLFWNNSYINAQTGIFIYFKINYFKITVVFLKLIPHFTNWTINASYKRSQIFQLQSFYNMVMFIAKIDF